MTNAAWGRLRRGAAASLLLLAVVAVLVHCCSAGAVPGAAATDERTVTVCSHNGRRYAAGAVWASTGRRRCAEFECGEDGAVTTTWCNNIMAGPTCRMVRGNASAPFPGCCPQLRCT